jgi:hypothetical protein
MTGIALHPEVTSDHRDYCFPSATVVHVVLDDERRTNLARHDVGKRKIDDDHIAALDHER